MTVMPRLAAIAVFTGAGALAADFLPLKEGNTWTYREAATGHTFTVRVGAQYMFQDRVYYSLAGYANSASATSKLAARVDERGQLMYFDEERYTERLLTSFEPFESGWWEAPARPCEQEGQTLEKRVAHEGPAGSFPDALQVRYRTLTCADAGLESELYVTNIGMVRRVEQSIAGPRQYDLVYARLGNLVIDSAQKARFTVSLDYPPQSEEATVTLRLESDPNIPLKLAFNSGQEYDVAIRDESGRVVWSWSAGRAFIQSLHEKNVVGGWTLTVAAPRSVLLAEGSTTVQGWLTTAPDAPQFAATVPIGPAPAAQPAAMGYGSRAVGVRRRE
jgi:hypothetical protein